jgi:ribosomal protein L6P/L9E
VVKNSNGEMTLNVTLYYAFEIQKLTAHFTFSVPKNKNDRNYERVLISSSASVCKMLSGVTGDFVTKMIMKDLEKFIDFPLKCPLPKVSY